MINELKKYAELTENASLKNYNTYRIGGEAPLLLSPNSIKDLINVIKILDEYNYPYLILGNGSNVILNSKKINGAVIRLNKLNGIEINPDKEMAYAEAGVMLPRLAIESVNAGLTGLEFAAGIPGTIGGSILGNAGAYNACILDYVASVTILDKYYDIRILEHEEIKYGYRTSIFKENKDFIILAAKFFLKKGEKENSLSIMEDRKRRRMSSQPLEYPSAGSVFRNPEGDFAGRIIESCGLKGYRIGGAQVSEKHANFIINKDNATSEDVYNLINYVHDTVLKKTNVDLKIEQEFIGWE